MVPIDHFDAAAEQRPDQAAIIDEDIALTYAELVAMSHRVGGFVSATADGDEPVPVALYSPNDHRVMVAMIGVMRAGGVVVPLHAANDLATSLHFLEQVSPRCLFFHSSLARRVAKLKDDLPSLQSLVCLDREWPGVISLAEILSEPALSVRNWIDCSGNRSRPMYYWATSGTSGVPKAVVEDCGGFDVMLRASRQRRDPYMPVGTTMSLAPMSHGGGPSAFATLTLGGTVLVLRAFDPRDVLVKIQNYRVTELWLSPTALTLLLDYPDVRAFDLSSLRCVLLGTAAIAPDTLQRAVDVFGPCISHSYGQIETSFVTIFDGQSLAAAVRGDRDGRLRSSGRSMNVNRVAVMADTGELLPPGNIGEIVVRGACVKRYVDAAMTQQAQRFGWHHTGDLGYVDADGFLYVTGRIKDIVNVAGFKVAAAEVERTIHELEEVQECAVVPAPNAVRGEIIRAIVTLRPGHAFSANRVTSHCRDRLGQGKTPAIVEHWTELPRSASGKIDKRRIRASDVSGLEPLSAVTSPLREPS